MPLYAVPPREFEARLRERCASSASKFHELLVVAAFWNPSVRLYRDPESGCILGPHEADIVARAHRGAFQAWLCLPLVSQFAHFARYLDRLTNEGCRTFVKLLAHPGALDFLVPPGSPAEAKMLFNSDLEALLAMTRDR
jgi:hypothetical protein